jgi:hypothetical protein
MRTPSIPWQQPIDGPDCRDEARISDRAVRLAEFLAKEVGPVSMEQRRFVAVLAAEMAQRVAEELTCARLPDSRPQTSYAQTRTPVLTP